MKTNLSLTFQILLCFSLFACENSTENKTDETGTSPKILSVKWNEVIETSVANSVIQKDVKNFASTNLENSRTLHVLLPYYYDSTSIRVKLTIEIDSTSTGISAIYYAINKVGFQKLPANKTVSFPTGNHTLSVYAENVNNEKSEVFTISEFNINSNYKILYANDGQDFPSLGFKNTLATLYANNSIEKIIVVGIDNSSNRLYEYGTIDSLGNSVNCFTSGTQLGTKAKEYTKFVTDEVLPYFNQNYRIKTGAENTAFMGSSLGGLSAFSISWLKPNLFGKVGAFSGSFWWRGNSGPNPTGEQINQSQIMHKLVRTSTKRTGMKFWFEAGTNDETDDRDNDGLIDAIDDTKDLMKELTTLGYTENQDFVYVQVQGGQHNQQTWASVLDDFLIWGFEK